MKIGDEVYIHGYIDEIRNDVIIIKNQGGYFGTVFNEVIVDRNCSEKPNNCEPQNHSGEVTEMVNVCPTCGRSDYMRSFKDDFHIKNSEYRFKCINCNTYIK